MRGFFSFLLVLVAFLALSAASTAYLGLHRLAHAGESDLLLIERAHAAEMDAKHALIDGIREDARVLHVSPVSQEEAAGVFLPRLLALEYEITGKDFHGFNASLWCENEGTELAACAPLIIIDRNERHVFLIADIGVSLKSSSAKFTSFIPKGTRVDY